MVTRSLVSCGDVCVTLSRVALSRVVSSP
ncbi:hypothetical protein CEXT_225071, partial [Caerostris extrusa]